MVTNTWSDYMTTTYMFYAKLMGLCVKVLYLTLYKVVDTIHYNTKSPESDARSNYYEVIAILEKGECHEFLFSQFFVWEEIRFWA